MKSDQYPIEIDGQRYNVDRNFDASPAIINAANATPRSTFWNIVNFVEYIGVAIFAKACDQGVIKIAEKTYEVARLSDGTPAIHADMDCLSNAMSQKIEAFLKEGGVIILARRV